MYSLCEYLLLPQYRASHGLWHTLLLCATLFAQDLRADGDVVRLKQSQGPITVTVFTPPAIYANAPTDVSLLLQRSDSAELLLDAAVTLRFIPASGVVIAPTKEFCAIGTNNETIVATHDQAASKFMYAAPIVFPVAGDGVLQALVRWHEQMISVEFPLSVLSPESRLTGLIPYLALPMAIIALFLANQWLRRPRRDRPVERLPKQFGVYIQPTRSRDKTTLQTLPDRRDAPLPTATGQSTLFPFRV